MRTRLLILLQLVIAFPIFAADTPGGAYGFTASPARIFVETKLGSQETQEIQLVNGSNSPVKVETYAWDLWYDKKGKIVYGPPGSFPNSLVSWIRTVPNSLVLGPRESGTVKVNIATPADAKGGHFGVVFSEVRSLEMPTPQGEEKTAAFALRLGTVVYQSTQGASTEELSVDKPKVTLPTGSNPLSLNVSVKNSGNTFLQPKLSARISDMSKRAVAKLALELPQTDPETMLPGQSRTFVGKFAGELEKGKYVALVNCEFGKEGLKTIEVPFTVR